jgi:hypothetical protein
MHTFFHGWRRKAGVVALVMALALMGGWIRSYALLDDVSFSTPWRSHCIVSASGKLSWVAGYEEHWPLAWVTVSRIDDDGGLEALYFGEPSIFDSRWIVSYWIPTIPLTLLSAYLILWKPRKRAS